MNEMKEMKDYSISICGYGYVGSAMGSLCEKNNVEFNVCDIQEKNGNFNYFNNISDLIHYAESITNTHYVVIAVPTPSNSIGECDVSIIKDILVKLDLNTNKETYVIIKSTIVPGTCKLFNQEFPRLNIVFFPEFLTEKNYLDDIYNAKFILLGIPPKFDMVKYRNVLKVIRLFYKHNSQIDILMRTYEECELFKYTVNNFLATKIVFFNEIHELCEKMNVDYQNLKSLFELEPRIGSYGLEVPGKGNNFYGFSLSCLPKEVKSMVKLQEKLKLSSELISCIDKRNKYFNNKQVKK